VQPGENETVIGWISEQANMARAAAPGILIPAPRPALFAQQIGGTAD